jgi:hypothetical protein
MGKRSDFPRFPQDSYNTPAAAVAPLLEHLRPRTQFIEPCAGNGQLARHLVTAGHVCAVSYDLPVDARTMRYPEARPGIVFITNPPWRRDLLHPIIVNLSDQAPTWLLIDADWIHTRQSIPYESRLRTIVSVGRVRWIPDSPYDGKDNCCWYLFDRPRLLGLAPIHFVGRADSATDPATRRAA